MIARSLSLALLRRKRMIGARRNEENRKVQLSSLPPAFLLFTWHMLNLYVTMSPGLVGGETELFTSV